MRIDSGEGLKESVAIVTGGGAPGNGIGNGRAAALLLADGGARVLVVDKKPDFANKTVEMIDRNGGKAISIEADVTNEADCELIVTKALSTWGRLDVLDNNVGIGSRGTVASEEYEKWQHVMKVNLDSMFLMSKKCIPAMKESSNRGSIINISSISAIRPRGLTAYSVSKSAVAGLTQAMALDHGPEGIRVNCVAPGPVYTPMVYRSGMSEKARKTRVKASVLGYEGTGWDIGHAVRFLASDRSRYITGQVLVVDGGVTLRGPERDTES